MGTNTEAKQQSDWQIFGTIPIQNRICVADTSYFYDEPVIVPLSAANYSISARYVIIDGHKHVARVRVAASDEPLCLGDTIGTVMVDFGQIGICDREAVEVAFSALGDAGMSRYYDQLNAAELISWIELPETKMLIVRPGFGDGAFPVHEVLRANKAKAGIEIDCIARDELH